MPKLDFRSPRLFVDAPLTAGTGIALDRDQSNYLGNVLRLAAGDTVLVFNGRDGEWQATLAGRKRPDRAEIVSLGEKVEVPAGTYERVMKYEETTPLENAKEYKWFAPGVGLIQDADLKLVKIEK